MTPHIYPSRLRGPRLLLGASLVLIPVGGCDRYHEQRAADLQPLDQFEPEHPHRTGMMGGVIASMGNDAYHAEAVLDDDDKLVIYLLGSDESRLQPVPLQSMTTYVKQHVSGRATAVLLEPAPLASDPKGTTTRFTAELPESLRDRSLYVVTPGLVIDNERYVLRFQLTTGNLVAMPAPVSDEQADGLYLTAGGLYTDEDIRANGQQTAAQQYATFQPEHDPNPATGDLTCPITKTKANPKCSWLIGGERYFFCCPPCIDEFLELAKTNPAAILPADEYRQSTK